jgi:cathepsin L
VGIWADFLDFRNYKSGVFDKQDKNCTNGKLDHAVMLVGYGTSAGQDYYILRNSWGTGWGEEGYMKVAIEGDGIGWCGV